MLSAFSCWSYQGFIQEPDHAVALILDQQLGVTHLLENFGLRWSHLKLPLNILQISWLVHD